MADCSTFAGMQPPCWLITGNLPQADGSSPVAAFYLDLGLKSLAGNNFEAALHRLDCCKVHLLKALAAHGDTALYTKLGAVCGSQV